MTAGWRRLAPGETDHELVWGAVGSVSLVLGLWWLTSFGPPPLVCPLRALTGVPCPTCGATRATLALLAGAWFESVRLNALVPVSAGAAAVYLPYAVVVSCLGLPRLRLHLEPRDRRWMRVMVLTGGIALWTFLILDGR